MPRYLSAMLTLYVTLVLALPGMVPLAHGEILTIDEDFSRTLRRDSLLTSADWDTTAQSVHLHPQVLSSRGIYSGTAVYGAAVGTNALFIADGSGGLRSLDISDPDQPALMDQISCADQARAVTLGPSHAYVAIGNGGLQVVGIDDPDNLQDLGAFDPGGQLRYINGVAVSNGVVYLAESDSGVTVVDVSDPANPSLLSRLDSGSWARDVHVHGDRLYVADSGLKIYDVSVPGQPLPLGEAPVTGTALRVSVAAGRAFVACGSSGLQVFDVSDPVNPVPLTTLDDWSNVQHATATAGGDTLFVAASTEGLTVLDFSDPLEPQEIDTRDTIQASVHVAYHQGLIFLCAVVDGLKIFELDPQGWDAERNQAQTVNLNPLLDPVTRVSLNAAVTDSVYFLVTGDGGDTWHDIEPDGSWLTFADTGTDIRWRALLVDTDSSPVQGPRIYSVTLTMDRQSSVPDINTVQDVPADDGGLVRVRWWASRHDSPEGDHTITQYSIYRRFDGAGLSVPPDTPYPPGQWDYVTSIPADMETEYASVVPTLADSNATDTHWTVFFVRARTDTPGLFFDSAPDSGYSVNNLQPAPPTGLVIDYDDPQGTRLSWDPSDLPDFAHFRVYRSSSPVPPGPGTLHTVTTDNTYLDEVESRYYYQLTVVDLQGRESDPSGQLSPTPGPTADLHLLPNHPNPFNPRTVITFTTDGSTDPVRLEIYDIRGHRVRSLDGPFHGTGQHQVVWDGQDARGLPCASGPYQVLLRQGTNLARRKILLIR